MHYLQTEFGNVDLYMDRAEFARHPAPHFHVGKDPFNICGRTIAVHHRQGLAPDQAVGFQSVD